MKALRHRFPVVKARWVAENIARHNRDVRRLCAIADTRPELQIRITCAGRADGVGGHALSHISALAFAINHRCRYLHTPFSRISHVEGDPDEWVRRWEAFFNFGYGEEPVPPDAEIVPLRKFVRLCRRDPSYVPGPRVVVQGTAFGYGEFLRSDSGRLTSSLRAKYFASDKSAIPVHREPSAISVAIHVRRGDVTPHVARYESDEPILNAIGQLRASLKSIGRSVTLNVYSEGKPDQFRAYSDAGCRLHLSTDTFETFHNLAAADVLLAAQSTFSWTAALLSVGIVINPSNQQCERDDWITRTPDGTFDARRLIDMMAARRLSN